jgi:hypothetical protein
MEMDFIVDDIESAIVCEILDRIAQAQKIA